MATITSTTDTSTAAVPLTTVFTPPASCDNLHWVSSKCLESTCKGIYNIVRATDTECYPSGWATTATGFSPGLSCPHNYYVNTSNVVVLGVGATETHATCCPSGYTVASSFPQVWYTREPCISISMGTTTIEYTVVGATPSSTTKMTYKNPIVHAMPVGLTYRSTDSASPTTSPASTSASATPTDTAAEAAGASSSESSSGLSTGAKAGIGVGVGVGALILFALGFFLFCRRRKNQKGAAGQMQSPAPQARASGPSPSLGPDPALAAAASAPAWDEPDSAGVGTMTKEDLQMQEHGMKMPPQPGFRASELPGSNPHVAELDGGTEAPLPPLPSKSSHSSHSPHSPHSPQSPHSLHSPQSYQSPQSTYSPNRF